MIEYKANLKGISVKVVKEDYTSGTSYLDGEEPNKYNYNRSRRISRGIFRSNTDIFINADVNAAYQIIKKQGIKNFPIKNKEQIVKLNVA